MTVTRDGEQLYEGVTSTGEMIRTSEGLTSFLTRHNTVPETTVLLTGISLGPEEEFTLKEGDRVDIYLERIGHLSNGVTSV